MPVRCCTATPAAVCSIYLPPFQSCNLSDLENLFTQLPKPVLLLGDFNAHSRVWGSKKVDRRGKIIEDLILKHNISILNDGSDTYLHPGTGSLSSIQMIDTINSIQTDCHNLNIFILSSVIV